MSPKKRRPPSLGIAVLLPQARLHGTRTRTSSAATNLVFVSVFVFVSFCTRTSSAASNLALATATNPNLVEMAGAMCRRDSSALAAALLVLLQHQLLHPLLPHDHLLRVLIRQVGPEIE